MIAKAMRHNFDAQRRETFDTFRDLPKGEKLPERAAIDFLFLPEEEEPRYTALAKALRAKGFDVSRDEDLMVATMQLPVTPDAIWEAEKMATEIALGFDFYPDGWDLGLDG